MLYIMEKRKFVCVRKVYYMNKSYTKLRHSLYIVYKKLKLTSCGTCIFSLTALTCVQFTFIMFIHFYLVYVCHFLNTIVFFGHFWRPLWLSTKKMNLSICLKSSPMQPVVEWGCLLRLISWKPLPHKWRSKFYNGIADQSLGNFQSLKISVYVPHSTRYYLPARNPSYPEISAFSSGVHLITQRQTSLPRQRGRIYVLLQSTQ